MAAMPAGDTSPEPSICPCCGALLPIPVEVPPAALSITPGRIAGAGCRVEVSEAGLVPRLTIETPGRIERSREPGRRLTRKGAMLLLVGPPVALALALALGPLDLGFEPLPAVLGLLALAFALSILVRVRWKPRGDLTARAAG